jgi:hypothetical protein
MNKRKVVYEVQYSPAYKRAIARAIERDVISRGSPYAEKAAIVIDVYEASIRPEAWSRMVGNLKRKFGPTGQLVEKAAFDWVKANSEDAEVEEGEGEFSGTGGFNGAAGWFPKNTPPVPWDRFFRVEKEFTLGYDSSVRNPTPSRFRRIEVGEILRLNGESASGNVFFIDAEGRRGKTEAGEVANLTRRGILVEAPAPKHQGLDGVSPRGPKYLSPEELAQFEALMRAEKDALARGDREAAVAASAEKSAFVVAHGGCGIDPDGRIRKASGFASRAGQRQAAELRSRYPWRGGGLDGVPALDKFTQGYVEAALWSSTGDDDEPLDSTYDLSDIADETRKTILKDTKKFQEDNAKDLAQFNSARAGHDFWLTRNGHGAGFWDGDYPEPQAARLTEASKAFGETDLYVGDDGKLYLSR